MIKKEPYKRCRDAHTSKENGYVNMNRTPLGTKNTVLSQKGIDPGRGKRDQAGMLLKEVINKPNTPSTANTRSNLVISERQLHVIKDVDKMR